MPLNTDPHHDVLEQYRKDEVTMFRITVGYYQAILPTQIAVSDPRLEIQVLNPWQTRECRANSLRFLWDSNVHDDRKVVH